MAEAVPGLTCILRLIKGRTFGCGASHFDGRAYYVYVLNTFQWDGVIQISWNFSLVYVPSHTPTGKRIIDEIYFKLFMLAMFSKL